MKPSGGMKVAQIMVFLPFAILPPGCIRPLEPRQFTPHPVGPSIVLTETVYNLFARNLFYGHYVLYVMHVQGEAVI